MVLKQNCKECEWELYRHMVKVSLIRITALIMVRVRLIYGNGRMGMKECILFLINCLDDGFALKYEYETHTNMQISYLPSIVSLQNP